MISRATQHTFKHPLGTTKKEHLIMSRTKSMLSIIWGALALLAMPELPNEAISEFAVESRDRAPRSMFPMQSSRNPELFLHCPFSCRIGKYFFSLFSVDGGGGKKK
ncbi:hypothetical protein K432DRAFT_83248 [Lepidopterella palustris CBS 459.81]|uniref:Uncharacterized protein n=1 Tax=Lepidopterella palustris CBS 459.81 TaxID=1314670 RepID=A0A8E2JDX0_9PEZI|nr:hypothetical protein K432DRAFT_83248 [Lepidopterella palustris CBS 459.81]